MRTSWVVLGAFVIVLVALGVYYSMIAPSPIIVNNGTINISKVNNSLSNTSVNLSSGNLSTVEGNNLFSFDLYSRYKSKDGNLFFSPYSISTALAMTFEGAKGQTAEEIQKVFYFPDDKDRMRAEISGIYGDLNNASKSYKLSTANALWAQKDYPFRQDYFDVINNFYNGKVTNLNFKTDTENSRITINTWVENQTNEKIKDLIPKGILSSDTRLVLTNAIYFKANWSLQFSLEGTYKQDFKLNSGENISTDMMHSDAYFNYGKNDEMQILEMPYDGDDLSMIVILPKGDLTELENSINASNLANWKSNMAMQEVRVSFPRFSFETKYMMAEDLAAMGMPTAFSPDEADFTGMWTRQDDENLYISAVIHQAFVNVTEQGTEAAAATAVIIGATTAHIEPPKPEPKIFNANHPFIFLIQDKKTGEILFMGRVSNPNA